MNIDKISEHFGISALSSERLDEGHINRTFLLTDGNGERYILQSLNGNIFRRPETVMQNISAAEAALSGCDKIYIPRYLLSGDKNYITADGEIWRMYRYTEKCGDVDSYGTGFAFGSFIKAMDGCKLSPEPPIENFHSFKAYLSRLKNAAANTDISRFTKLGEYLDKVFTDDIPKHIIHGDAKTANVITGQKYTVIDLDTIMYGYAALDYGDMVRSVCGGGIDLQAVHDLTKGFAEGLGGILTKKENATLFSGILWVTGELAMRYMTDYLTNEGYFTDKTPEQCLERAETLCKLLDSFQDMENDLKCLIYDSFR